MNPYLHNTNTNPCNPQGILFTTGDAIKSSSEFIRLWMHEATRVYSDKLVDSADNDAFAKLIAETIKKNCEVSPYFY